MSLIKKISILIFLLVIGTLAVRSLETTAVFIRRKRAFVEKVVKITVLSPSHTYHGKSIYAIPAAFGPNIPDLSRFAVSIVGQPNSCKNIEKEFPQLSEEDLKLINATGKDFSMDNPMEKRRSSTYEQNINWIGLIPRGGCAFDVKVKQAEMTGYNAVAIYNPKAENHYDVPIRMNPSDYHLGIKVLSIFISYSQVRNLIEAEKVPKTFIIQLEKITWIDFKAESNSRTIDSILSSFLLYLSIVLLMASALMSIGVIYGLARNYMLYGHFVFEEDKPRPLSAIDQLDFPLKVFKSSDFEGKDHSICCAICIEDFEVGCCARILPCGHQFHDTCVDPWLLRHNRLCPICKRDVHEMSKELQKKHTIQRKTFKEKVTAFANKLISSALGVHRYTPARTGDSSQSAYVTSNETNEPNFQHV